MLKGQKTKEKSKVPEEGVTVFGFVFFIFSLAIVLGCLHTITSNFLDVNDDRINVEIYK